MTDKSRLLEAAEVEGGEPVITSAAVVAAKPPAILYVFVVIAAMANILFGYEASVIASGITDYMGCTRCDTTQQGFLKGALALGATVVCPFAGLLQDRLGRRVTLIICCLIYCGCVFVTATANTYESGGGGGYFQMAIGRFMTGMVIGIFSSTVPMYIAELSPPSIRGALVTVNQVCVCTGVLLGYVSSAAFTPHWQIQFYAASPLATCLFLSFIFITPYSPRWLMTQGREEEARAVLRRIRSEDVVEEELASIRDGCALVTLGGSKYKMLLEPHIRWAVTIGVMGACMAQWVGVNAVNGFAPNIFESAGSTKAQAHIQTVYIGVAKLFFVVVALLLMDRVGRKPLLLVGCVGMAASSALLAASYQIPNANWLAVGSLVLYMAFFEISLGPILWLLLSELYPVQVKGVAMSIGVTTTW